MERMAALKGGVILFSVMIVLSGTINTAWTEGTAGDESSCVSCHSGLGGKFAEPVSLARQSIHTQQEVTCHDCHGGDPASFDEDTAHSGKKGFTGKPPFDRIPEFCASCHADPQRMKRYNLRTDQLALYKTSHHGRLLYEKRDPRTATCISCHGSHDIKGKDNPLSRVFKANIAATCARCHSDREMMGRYRIPADQYEQYTKSVHGRMLLERHDPRAPTCSDCHGFHSANPPGYEIITTVCQMCHGTIGSLFKESPHYFEQTNEEVARCIDCHGDHDVVHATTALYEGEEERHCGECHDADSKQIRLARLIKTRIDTGVREVRAAARSLEEVKDSGKSLADIQETFEDARSELIKARAATHTLAITRIDQYIKPAVRQARKVQRASARILKELSARRKGAIVVLAILGVIIALVYLKITTL
ncbi:MAG: cytochrome c3 family protein [Deltaproteobacteria bacterium]|nr:cytochrome c3 family protein [Deltaproteobacteria bacterium]